MQCTIQVSTPYPPHLQTPGHRIHHGNLLLTFPLKTTLSQSNFKHSRIRKYDQFQLGTTSIFKLFKVLLLYIYKSNSTLWSL